MNETMKGCGLAGDAEHLRATRAKAHPRCVVCSPGHPKGLGQQYVLQPDGSVESTFFGGQEFEGYEGRIHGGVAAALLDGAMTNCLFAHGRQAVTAELTVRYREPVAAHAIMRACARLTRSHGRLHLLRAELWQDGRPKVTAIGKFIETHE